MALIHADPFAHYSTAQYTDIYTPGGSGSTLAIGAYGRSGRPALRFSGGYPYSVDLFSLSTSGSVCIFQGDFRISVAPPSTNVIFAPWIGATIQCSLDLNTDRTLSVHRGIGGTKVQLGSNSSYVVPIDTHIHIAAKFTIANSGGSIEVHVWEDGDTAAQVVLNVTGQDTQDGGSAAWDGFNLGAACDGDTDWSNLVVMDGSGSALNDFLGPADVWALWANARTTPALTDWSLSTGSEPADLIDEETPDDDSSYLEETTQNQQMTVAVDPVPYPGRTIFGAQLYASVKLTSGSPTLRAIGYQSSTANLGVTFSPGAAYTYLRGAYSTLPDGSAFSDAASFDALQWGLKLTTSATGARVTQIVVALIQSRDQGQRNLLTGYGHTVTGEDNLAAGQSNVVTGSASQAHGSGGTVVGDRSVLFNLDGVTRTVIGNGKFEVYGQIGGDLGAARGNVISTSAHGSEPASPVSGDLDLYDNSFYVSRYSGSAWTPWGPIFKMTPPVSGDFAWVNQGGASIDTTNGGIYLLGPAGAGDNLRVRKKSAPATPYTITAAFLHMATATDFPNVGLLFRESSSGKMATCCLSGAATDAKMAIATVKFTDATTFSANYTNVPFYPGPVVWLRIADNGTNRISSWSADGQHWFVLHSVGRTDFLTANEVGFYVNANNATWPAAMTLVSWKEA